MPFSEKIKLKVKHKAAFRCCRCHEIGVDAHHIIPEFQGGTDDMDNASPLCQNCHDRFGGNPDKRKEIKQMRDWWYDVVVEKYTGDADKYETLNNLLLKLQKAIESQSTDVKELKEKVTNQLEAIKIETKNINQPLTDVQHKVSEYIAATRLADRVYANFLCRKCGTAIGLLVGSNKCPNCGEQI